jgi:PPOX class probable FMN-dependent enzyme
MTDLEDSFVTNIDGLAAHYAKPAERVLKKRLEHVNAVGRAFIAASPFLVLATGSREGLDCSPKGDRPGFVEVSDDGRTLLIPDRRGNNLIDGLRNLVEDARIGLIFLVPGVNETYRVNGHARISTDANLRRRFAVDGKEPATVMVVTVEQAFPHCPKALVRSDLWKAASSGRPKGVPTLGDFVTARDREQTVPRSTQHTANVFRTNFTDCAAVRGRETTHHARDIGGHCRPLRKLIPLAKT